jgi:hypothetical protein
VRYRTTSRGAQMIAGAAAVALGLGLGAGPQPASAVGNGHFEAILCHCQTQAEAARLQAAAQRLGYKAVIQVIHPNDIEVELDNGLQTKAEADRFCAQEQPKLSRSNLHCHAEQEMHGLPSDWTQGNGGGTTGHPKAPPSTPTPPTTKPRPPITKSTPPSSQPPTGQSTPPSRHVHKHHSNHAGSHHPSDGWFPGYGSYNRWAWFY